jgi:hypothetical protein
MIEYLVQMSLAPDHHMIRHSLRIDPISRSTESFCQGEAGAGRLVAESMIAFGGIDVVRHVAARGRTGGPEKFHSSTAKDFFSSIGT